MVNSIPIIDLQRISESDRPHPIDWENVAREIRSALNEVGFMYIINHGIPEDVIAENFQVSTDFFALPQQVKRKYKKNLDESRNGWVEPGEKLLHHHPKFEYRECFDITRQKPFYPTDIPSFRSSHMKLESLCHKLIKSLLKLLAISLKLTDSEYFIKCCRHLDVPETANESDFSMIHYPPIRQDISFQPDTSSSDEHTDYEIMTLLFQNDFKGLELKTVDGHWISADCVPNSILVNTGDLLEMWTNKFYPATLHRVVMPKTADERAKSRYAFAYFIAPDSQTIIRPLKSEIIKDARKIKGNEVIADKVEEAAPVLITALEHIMERVKIYYNAKKECN